MQIDGDISQNKVKTIRKYKWSNAGQEWFLWWNLRNEKGAERWQ